MNYDCKQCGYTTQDTSHWHKHISTQKHIIKTKPYSCDAGCDKRFSCKSNLNKHIKICKICVDGNIDGNVEILLLKQKLEFTEKLAEKDKAIAEEKIKNAEKIADISKCSSTNAINKK